MSAEAHAFEEIAAKLLGAIEAGDYQPGDQLPSEHDLAARYGVGRNTVQRALRVLIDRGVAEAKRRRGTFVRVYDRQLVDTSLRSAGREFGARVMVMIVEPPARVAERLPGESDVVRRRVIGTALHDTYYAGRVSDAVPELKQPRPLDDPDSILMERAGLEVRQRATVFARMPTSEEERLLGLPPGTPVLEQVTSLVDGEGATAAVRVEVYASDRHALDIELAH
ncbi:phosphonate metabolism transcriptional regulator PhnF [Nonomuraea africana]|uniref:DNA-binding GntR family transcriptional regulator n=1 Tax=Nonomuraea africana TaxID=46171 RepID=A0ABR9KYD5_9ACTN|nr:GntR family transcriptional regulator [Nonomuraea africana]MBE1566577.1 DNA-binding GntR family transcriptional regulator [Nonomuraea africana]